MCGIDSDAVADGRGMGIVKEREDGVKPSCADSVCLVSSFPGTWDRQKRGDRPCMPGLAGE